MRSAGCLQLRRMIVCMNEHSCLLGHKLRIGLTRMMSGWKRAAAGATISSKTSIITASPESPAHALHPRIHWHGKADEPAVFPVKESPSRTSPDPFRTMILFTRQYPPLSLLSAKMILHRTELYSSVHAWQMQRV